MENLNAEQIIKALECCIDITDWMKCRSCPYYDNKSCYFNLKTDALSLIKRLTEENERLREDNEIKSQKRVSTFEIVNVYERARADTVREMQERLKAQKFTHKNFGELVYVEDIDQIAKEMVEGTK